MVLQRIAAGEYKHKHEGLIKNALIKTVDSPETTLSSRLKSKNPIFKRIIHLAPSLFDALQASGRKKSCRVCVQRVIRNGGMSWWCSLTIVPAGVVHAVHAV